AREEKAIVALRVRFCEKVITLVRRVACRADLRRHRQTIGCAEGARQYRAILFQLQDQVANRMTVDLDVRTVRGAAGLAGCREAIFTGRQLGNGEAATAG